MGRWALREEVGSCKTGHMNQTLYVIDGFAQIFRAYYAIRGGMRSAVTGEPTQALYGFAGMLLKVYSQLKPDFLLVVVDAPGRTFRDDLYADYKATRNATPDDLIVQIPRILEMLEKISESLCYRYPGCTKQTISIASVVTRGDVRPPAFACRCAHCFQR